MTSPIPLSEPCIVPDIFVSGVARCEELSPNLYRVTYYTQGSSTYDGSPERVVVARFIVTFETLIGMATSTVNHKKFSNSTLGLPETSNLN